MPQPSGTPPPTFPRPDVFQVADLLIARALANHAGEIDLIAYYGSYAQGVAHPGSDLDIFYIPAEGQDPPVGHTVLVAGLLYDFWGIRWETVEGFATGRVRGWAFAPALVRHAVVLHARSAEQAARWAALQQQVLDLQKREARPQMVGRAVAAFKEVLARLGNLRLAATDDLADARYAGWGLILAAWECLCLANQTFSSRGWAYLLEDIPLLRHRPDDLEALIVAIATSDDVPAVCSAAERLALGTRRVLRDLLDALPARREPGEVFDSAYPELRDGLGKVSRACARGRPVAASSAAWSAQAELTTQLHSLEHEVGDSGFSLYHEIASPYRRLGFPDLLGRSYADLDAVGQDVRLLDARLREWLAEQGVGLNEFETVEDFERSLC